MSAGVDEGARKSGAKLVMEVEIEGLSSVLKSVRELVRATNTNNQTQIQYQNGYFGIPELDTLLSSPAPPLLELVSPPPTHHASGAGKTSLLYLIIAHAILPAVLHPNTSVRGHEAAVLVFDPLHHFSIPRLICVMLQLLFSSPPTTAPTADHPDHLDSATLIKQSLQHLHIFRPQSWSCLLATLRSLPEYLFAGRHKSMHRAVHALVLDDIDAFMFQMRAASLSSSSAVTNDGANTPTDANATANPLTTASAQLTAQITRLSSLLSCATILTSQSVSPSMFRPALPVVWPPGVVVTRLGLRRVEVGRFRSGISAEEAEAEREARWDVVKRARFECWQVGADSRFVFRVSERGVEIERVD